MVAAGERAREWEAPAVVVGEELELAAEEEQVLEVGAGRAPEVGAGRELVVEAHRKAAARGLAGSYMTNSKVHSIRSAKKTVRN